MSKITIQKASSDDLADIMYFFVKIKLFSAAV